MNTNSNPSYKCDNKFRIEWVDWIKGIMMLVIIVSHVGTPDIYVKFYTPIFLTIYFFLSGFTWSPKNNYKSYFVRKVKNLVFPLLFLGSFNAILAIIVEGDLWLDRFSGLLLQRSCNWDDLWFIACLFSSQIIFYITHKLYIIAHKNIAVLIFLPVAISAIGFLYISYIDFKLPWQFENAMVLQLFVAQGYLHRNYLESIMNKIGKYFMFAVILFSIYVTLVLLLNNDVNIHAERYDNFVLFIISALIGINFIVIFAKIIANNYSKRKNLLFSFVSWGGKNTLVYYAFQSKAIILLKIIFDEIGLNINGYILCIMAAVIIFGILAIPAYIIRKFLPFMVGDFSNIKFGYISKIERGESL